MYAEAPAGSETISSAPVAASATGGTGRAAAKQEALEAAGVRVGQNPTEASQLMVEVVKELG